MKPHQDRSRLASRVSAVVGITALVAVAVAARSQGGQQTAPPPQPAAAMPMADSTMQDTMRADTTAMVDSIAMSDSAMMVLQLATPVTPAPQPLATWPVDPVTGQTIINGEPVVGRVFIMQKPDGLVKLGTWQAQYVGEPIAPEAAIVGGSYAVPAPEHTRRVRTIMTQATLWGLDGKRSATERRFYRAQTTGAAVAQP